MKGLLLRYIKSVSDFNELKINDLDNLPEPIKTQFLQLCQLAYMSFTKLSVQVTFTDSDALYGCLDSLGLMQSSADLFIDTGTTVTHSFLHFTIQEFLAAYHLSHAETKVQELYLETHCHDPQSFMIIRFSIGLNSKILQLLKSLEDCILIEKLHWLYESQSPGDVCKCLGSGDMFYSSHFDTAFDLFALSYCICHSNCTWHLVINLSDVNSVFGQKYGSVDDVYCGYIKKLTIYKATSSGISTFFSLPKHIFDKLSNLQFLDTKDTIDSTLTTEIICSELVPCLRQFTLHYLDSKYSNVYSVIDSVCRYCPKVEYFSFKQSVFSILETTQLCKFVSSQSSLSEIMLKLVDNIFTGDSLQQLASGITHAISLVYLDLSYNRLPVSVLQILSDTLEINTSLKTLQLNHCCIQDDGVYVLANGLKKNNSLVEVGLNWNVIGVDGAASLSSMLIVNASLKKLYLGGNESIGTFGAIKLIKALKCNSTLETLILSPKCKPVEFSSVSMQKIRKSSRLNFVYLPESIVQSGTTCIQQLVSSKT